MYRLLLAEVLRLRYRPRVGWAVLSVLLLGLLGPLMWLRGSGPVSADDYAEAAARYEAGRADCPECTIESYLPSRFSFEEIVYLGIGPWMLLISVYLLVVVVVYVSADFASGAITTQLTFTPCRKRLLAARVAVSGLLGMALMAVAVVASTVMSITWYVGVNGYDALPARPGLLHVIMGSLLLGFIVGVIAALLVFLFHGGLAAGVMVTVALLGSFLVEVLSYELRPPSWVFHAMPTRQAESLVIGLVRPGYEQPYLRADEALNWGESALYFGALVLLTAVLSAVSFVRRDITN